MLFKLSAAALPLALGACAQAIVLPKAVDVAPAFLATVTPSPLPAVTVVHTIRPVTEPSNWQGVNDSQAPGKEGQE